MLNTAKVTYINNTVENKIKEAIKEAINFSNPAEHRAEARISLSLKMYLRRTINNTTYFRAVKTENVSLNGAKIICDVPLEQGAELIFSGLNGKFSAVVKVRHVASHNEGGWAIGLEFIKKIGKWVVIN
ncbi:MAG: PilZ domain-containing protein [Blastocatellia bacterium]|nr:PilZ domain-containing protein [Blastocatellia bacterium]MBL8192465.1 PilZ domain-containing protein [Blastocatellia bacterium]MBN8724446.1 PilZ domain-containing protein [Acidobacteriota bacterium]